MVPTGSTDPKKPIYPVFRECLPGPVVEEGRYTVRFAQDEQELDALQKLRFEVFNLELGEGLESSFATGRDRDRFDYCCHHLIVIENEGGTIVGTYRMQTSAMASHHEGFYSGDEFDLRGLPPGVMDNAIEVGRACVARPFRNRQVLFLLWKGLAAYLQRNSKHYLFGCCSLTSQDPLEGARVMRYLERKGHLEPTARVLPQPGWECFGDDAAQQDPGGEDDVVLPQLFRMYLRYGAKVCGPPAIDRFFKTIDYLVLLDTEALGREVRQMFFR